jgi:hypothetical protein
LRLIILKFNIISCNIVILMLLNLYKISKKYFGRQNKNFLIFFKNEIIFFRFEVLFHEYLALFLYFIWLGSYDPARCLYQAADIISQFWICSLSWVVFYIFFDSLSGCDLNTGRDRDGTGTGPGRDVQF